MGDSSQSSAVRNSEIKSQVQKVPVENSIGNRLEAMYITPCPKMCPHFAHDSGVCNMLRLSAVE